MKKIIVAGVFSFGLMLTGTAHAQFSTDAPILWKMLLNNISQLSQLLLLVEKTTAQVRMMKDLQAGINEALKVHESIRHQSSGDIFENWKTAGESITKINQIYGKLRDDKRSMKGLSDTDRTIAESLAFRSSALESADKVSQFATELKNSAGLASPKGAARLTAQGIGSLIEASSEGLRTQNESLKLQASILLKSNSEDKARSNHILLVSDEMKRLLTSSQTKFQTPRL